ncbi:MAG: peroxiredoxin family protein, partial [Anaerolineae bacterium]
TSSFDPFSEGVGVTVTEGKKRCPLLPRGKCVHAWVLVVLVTSLGAAAAGDRGIAGLLQILNLSGYPPGTTAPDFVSRTADGKPVSLAALRGRVILLTFWATWCPPCREEMPAFEQLHRDLARKGLAVLGINAQESAELCQRFAKELDLTFPLVLDPKGRIHKAYGVIGLPSTFLIARDGRAVARAIGERDWGTAKARALIQALLAEPVSRETAQ